MFFLAIIGFSAIALSMTRHHSQVFKRRRIKDAEAHILKAIGYSSLIISAIGYSNTIGSSYGITFWVGILTVALWLVVLFLTYYKKS